MCNLAMIMGQRSSGDMLADLAPVYQQRMQGNLGPVDSIIALLGMMVCAHAAALTHTVFQMMLANLCLYCAHS